MVIGGGFSPLALSPFLRTPRRRYHGGYKHKYCIKKVLWGRGEEFYS